MVQTPHSFIYNSNNNTMSQLLLLLLLPVPSQPQPILTLCINSNINNWAHFHLPRQLHHPSRMAPLPTFMQTYPSMHANNINNIISNNTTRSTCSQACISNSSNNNINNIQHILKPPLPLLTLSLSRVRCTPSSTPSSRVNNNNDITITIPILTITPIRCTGWTTTAQESDAEDDRPCRPFIYPSLTLKTIPWLQHRLLRLLHRHFLPLPLSSLPGQGSEVLQTGWQRYRWQLIHLPNCLRYPHSQLAYFITRCLCLKQLA